MDDENIKKDTVNTEEETFSAKKKPRRKRRIIPELEMSFVRRWCLSQLHIRMSIN